MFLSIILLYDRLGARSISEQRDLDNASFAGSGTIRNSFNFFPILCNYFKCLLSININSFLLLLMNEPPGYRLGNVHGMGNPPTAAPKKEVRIYLSIYCFSLYQKQQIDCLKTLLTLYKSIYQERVKIVLWRTGFTLDDGPLRGYNRPENQAFLDAIKRGYQSIYLFLFVQLKPCSF